MSSQNTVCEARSYWKAINRHKILFANIPYYNFCHRNAIGRTLFFRQQPLSSLEFSLLLIHHGIGFSESRRRPHVHQGIHLIWHALWVVQFQLYWQLEKDLCFAKRKSYLHVFENSNILCSARSATQWNIWAMVFGHLAKFHHTIRCRVGATNSPS